MKRDLVITVLLVLAGIILAFVLFGAGAVWIGKGSRKSSSKVVPARLTKMCLDDEQLGS